MVRASIEEGRIVQPVASYDERERRRVAGARRVVRRRVSTPDRDSGCRLAVKRFALGPLGRPAGDGGVEHPLGGGCVGPGAPRSGDRDRDVLLEGAVAGRVVGGAVLPDVLCQPPSVLADVGLPSSTSRVR